MVEHTVGIDKKTAEQLVQVFFKNVRIFFKINHGFETAPI